ncbi:hypothetical protein BLAHAN_05769 [Blautia hansenii DSM 20583]|jgi:hypothetical protein|uniref:Uncharacterized protein n=1 Tax=Blautia hansenii DSM 20583 TaxID=537007 RepID=C9L8P7_BLAHA|nr:hypothetical protein BLAHAN_05769 [Blautia hansenii DSM 20583]
MQWLETILMQPLRQRGFFIKLVTPWGGYRGIQSTPKIEECQLQEKYLKKRRQ